MSRIWEALQTVEQTGKDSDPAASKLMFRGATDIDLPQVSSQVMEPPLALPDEACEAAAAAPLTVDEVPSEYFSGLICHTAPSSPAADRFRLLRMRLRDRWAAATPRTFLITSALPEDGKTTVSLNLATVLVEQRERKVLLIDADLRRRSVTEQLGLAPRTGLAECLQQELDPLTVIRPVEPLGWSLLSAGKVAVPNPAELLRSQAVAGVVRTLAPHFNWIVIDSPPTLTFTDAISLSHAADGTLLVARAGRTPKKAIEEAIDLLGRKQIVGLVLNGIDKSDQPYSKHYNYYSRIKRSEVPNTITVTETWSSD